MSFYRPPINPGWDDFGARIQQGVQNGIGLMVEGHQRRREQARQDAADQTARDQLQRQRMLENVEMGVIPEADAYEPARPSLAGAAGGVPHQSVVPDWMGSGNWHGEMHDVPDGVDPSVLNAPAQPQAAPAAARRLRPGVQQVGGLFLDPTQSLAFRRQQAQTVAEHQLADDERDRKMGEVRMALVAAGMDPKEANRRATASAYGITLPETAEERANRVYQEETAREPFRQADDARSMARSLALMGASGGRNGGGAKTTAAQQRAATADLRNTAEDTAYRVIRSDPTISEQELTNYLRRTDVIGRDLPLNHVLNAIATAQSRYARENSSGQMGQIQERGREGRARRRQVTAAAQVSRQAPAAAAAPPPPVRATAGTPPPPATRPAAQAGNAAGGARGREAITQAEFAALTKRGFTDQQIRSRYQVR